MKGETVIFRSLLFITIVCIPSTDALQAQLLGQQRLRDFSRRSSTGTSTLFGADLGIQERRGPGAFVGADPTDTQGFVGVEQAEVAPPVVAATESLTADPVLNVNQPLAAQTAGGIYAPRLTIAFSVVPPVDRLRPPVPGARAQLAPHLTGPPRTKVSSPLLSDPAQRIEAQLAKTLGNGSPVPIRVSVENRTATLAGAVASTRDRELAELLTSFEPGIDQVRNQLSVEQPSRSTPE
ncbi:MAG: BON domain-containing protein [Planctomycetaceae bacterium]|nr:BON domain-containing protein [Planctomycetaceae bacterium]